jgi:CBS domain containing-hemolysin-like protein
MVPAAFLLLPAAVALDEASAWFARNTTDPQDAEADALEEALRASSRAHLVGRFLVALSFALLAREAARTSAPWAWGALLAWGTVWTLVGAALSGLRWQSPWSLAGRAAYRPLRWLGFGLDRMLRLWGGAWARRESLSERARERQQEVKWLLGRTGEDTELRMLATLQEFGEATVEDVMLRREEIVAIPSSARLPEILEIVDAERYTRYPVYEGSLDTVIGVLHVFDLLAAPPDAGAGTLARKPVFTNATKPVGNLLRELQVTYNQMAVVVDEYGGTAGLATVEDLIEELVGEIEDEDDELEAPLRRLEPGAYWVLGTMRIEELNEALELDLPEGEYDTVAGLVLDRLERIPHPGERLQENGVLIEVLASEPQRIQAVRVVVDDSGRTVSG